MDMDSLRCLDILYLDSCRQHDVRPNASVLSWLAKAEEEKSSYGKYSLVLLLDRLKNADLFPLIDLFLEVDDSGDLEKVDLVHHVSACALNGELLMSLIRAVGKKLNLVHLQDMSFGDDFFSNLSQTGISCKVMNLGSIGIQKLTMIGSFSQLQTLNLDFCNSITTFHRDCFSLMPNLARLSMCETRVANLWTTVAALSNLPSLVEIRFQKCPCCRDTARCPSLFGKKANYLAHQETLNPMHHPSPICYEKHYRQYMVVSLPRLEVLDNLPILETEKHTAQNVFSSYYEYLPYKWRWKESVVNVLRGRELGADGFYHPRSFKRKDSVSRRRSHCFFFPNALSAVKLGSSAWPLIEPISNLPVNEESKRLRPRQFEYHPSDSGLMVFGTLDGEIVVVNHENRKVVHYGPSVGDDNSIIGLCWLKKYPSKLIAGSDNGAIKLFDIASDQPKSPDPSPKYKTAAFECFENLTSVHVNSTDEWFLASGYSRDVALYDIATARRMELFTGMHREPINVAKFAHHSPFMFATSSFDRDVKMWDLREKLVRPCYTASSSRGNVMVCFSHDDLYLLVSAVDNEVKQLLAVDGSLHTKFEIATTGSGHNYTRSYYMNGRDYIISGSCDEPLIRICCAQTGRRLRDVHLEEAESGNPLYVQSLRGDPFRNFHLSALTAPRHPGSKCDIMKINLLASDASESESESSHVFEY